MIKDVEIAFRDFLWTLIVLGKTLLKIDFMILIL